jgi:hypothetical protein
MPNQSISTQFTFGSSATTEDDPIGLVALKNNTVLVWNNAAGNLYRCCPAETEPVSLTPNSTLLEKLSDSSVLVDANPLSIYDVDTNSVIPIFAQLLRGGSAKCAGSHCWFLSDGDGVSNPYVSYLFTGLQGVNSTL